MGKPVEKGASEMETAFFARLVTGGKLIDGNGQEVGVAFPSSAWPGDLMICLRTDLIEALRAA